MASAATPPHRINVCVVGGGIVGVSTALAILQHQQSKDVTVTIIADQLTPNTTGDGSAGFWMPYLIPNNPQQKKYQWCADTYRHIESIYRNNSNSNNVGINLLSGYVLFGEEEYEGDVDESYWTDLVYGFRQATPEELRMFPKAKTGFHFTTYTLECVKYLPHLLEKFVQSGGKVVCRKVGSFEELFPSYDIICNCTGYGSKDLANDTSMVPIRGQVIRVSAPWVKHFATFGDSYILPNSDNVVLGGTHQEHDVCTEPYQSDIEQILAGCQRVVPSLKDARILKHWVGLRPGRSEVRMEVDTSRTYKGKAKPVIHNYGHGGSGVTIHWGCALDCARLLYGYVNDQRRRPVLSAKL